MRRLLPRVFLVLSIGAAVAAFPALRGQDAPAPEPSDQEYQGDPQWPRVIEEGDTTFTIYQPQIDKFDATELEARAAVQVETQLGDKKQTTYGVIWITARTEIDKENRLVQLDDIQIVKANFPTAGDKVDQYLDVFRRHAEGARTVSLSRIEANLAITQADRKGQAVPVKNDPPKLYYRDTPALLVLIDGEPAIRPVEGVAGVERVINTRALILKAGGRFYMPIADRWVAAASPLGPWQLTSSVPEPVQGMRDSIAKDENQTQVDLLRETSDDVQGVLAEGRAPEIIVSTEPAELLVTQGKAEMKPVAGTQLLYVTNTTGDILFDIDDQSYYVSLTGRWYRGRSLEGPWTFVEGDKLPADFAKIPESEPKSSVLATVPGTPAAQEAAIANSIPQTAEVNREEAQYKAQYDGEPKFEDVPDTSMQYAVNSPTPVIRVDPTTYYAVQGGVWFTAAAAFGPWIVATAVPPVIYSIPPACPIHYATYVRIYRYSPTTVWVGYTPGYLGTCYAPWGTVVYGTGWYYRPWIGSYWYGAPWTWGFGVGFWWNPWSGWGWGFGWGGYRPYYRPWWGPYYGMRPRPPAYRSPYPGRPTPYGPGYRAPRYNWNNMNVYGRPGQTRPGVRPAVVRPAPMPGVPPSSRPAPGVRPAPGARPAPGTTGPGTRPAPGATGPSARPAPGGVTRPTRPDNVYAGPDGNVYRPRPGKPGTWETNDRGKWKPVESGRPATQPPSSARPAPEQPSARPAPQPSRPTTVDPRTMNQLSRDYKGRQAAETRMNPPPARPPSPPRSAPAPRPAPPSRKPG
ncbi:MAG: hypothetical protein ACM3NW_11935 [Syntrophomonadaceae bacterium]